jgi:hypothetical protein
MSMIFRLNESVKFVHDPEEKDRFLIGVVTGMVPWKGVENGATYFVRWHQGTEKACVGEFRTDNDRHYIFRHLNVDEKVLFEGEDGRSSRSGKVIEAIPWDNTKKSGCNYKVLFEDNGAEQEFVTGRDVHFLRSVA